MSTSAQTQQSPANIDQLCINYDSHFAMDAVQQANSGHPGTPMAMAPVIYSLWQNFLSFDPTIRSGPIATVLCFPWEHASTLLYSMLHLTQVKAVNPEYESLGKPSVTLEDVKEFPAARQQVSRASGISLDIGNRNHHRPARQASQPAWEWRSPANGWDNNFNRPSFDMIGFDVYALAGDGCMMEGVSARLHRLPALKLSNLCWIYDNNHILLKATRRCRTATMWPRASSDMGGTSRAWAMPTQEMLKRAFKCFPGHQGPATLIIVE